MYTSASVGYVRLEESEQVLKTIDGGLSWETVDSDEWPGVPVLFFLDFECHFCQQRVSMEKRCGCDAEFVVNQYTGRITQTRAIPTRVYGSDDGAVWATEDLLALSRVDPYIRNLERSPN